MNAPISKIVDRVIAHARKLATTIDYDWATARAALAVVLADLEAREPSDPSLARLRAFIADGDSGKAPNGRRKKRDEGS
jgi:hypothetical protein